MTSRGPDTERDEELAALERLQEMPDFLVYLALLRRHAEDLRHAEHKVLVDEKCVAEHNYRTGQVDGMQLASRLADLIAHVRTRAEKVMPNG